MLTSKDHYNKAVELLKARGITNITRHFSPFDESGHYDQGSGCQVFHSENRTYMYVFDKEGTLVSYTEFP